jgi:ElaB/YqjD/DUF883 family membrane-anchored ribosome-binding protein
MAMQSDPNTTAGNTAWTGQATASPAQASEPLRGILDQPIASGADFVAQIARTARGLADDLDGGAPQLAQMVRRAASSAESFSDDIRDKSVGEFVEATQDFARRQPALFIGAAATAGFVLARLLKAGVVDAEPQPRTDAAAVEPARAARTYQPSTGSLHDA